MLYWTCHVCGDLRPDNKISVYKKDQSEKWGLPHGSVTQNVRYCNDKPECIEGAPKIDLCPPPST